MAVFNKDDITKFNIAVINERSYETVLKYPPVRLRMKISTMLVNLDQGKIIDEQLLNEY